MAVKNVKINREGHTVYVKVGRYIEPFDVEYKSPEEIVTYTRTILMTAGIRLEQSTVDEMLREVRVIV